MITIIAIIIITTIVARYYKTMKEKKTSEETDTIGLLSADELIRKTGAEIKGIDDDGKYTILFQGGCFEITTSNETYMDVYYSHFAEFEEHEAIKALFCMNLINLSLDNLKSHAAVSCPAWLSLCYLSEILLS
jgi:hypothetical protein